MATTKTVGEGIQATVDGKTLTLVIDLSRPGEPSASGKTLVFASTRGNVTITTDGGPIVLGLNAYRRR